VKKVRDEIQASARPDTPLYRSEFNASNMNEVPLTDSAFIGRGWPKQFAPATASWT
jgi:hypothetical protein